MMDIRRIDFDDDGKPEYVTFRMHASVAVYLAKLCGKESQVTANDLVPRFGGGANNAAYEGLTGDFLNRIWDGGVDEAMREY